MAQSLTCLIGVVFVGTLSSCEGSSAVIDVTDADSRLDAASLGDGLATPDVSVGLDGGRDAPSAEAGTGGGPTLGGCPLFPSSYPYNQDISGSALDPGSAGYITNLKARAGAIVAEYPGIEFMNVVPASQPNVPIQSGGAYGFDPSDVFFHSSTNPPSPIPAGAVYENMGTPNADHHMMVIQQGTCRLFELYGRNPSSPTSGWDLSVTWNLTKNEQLPDGWGSTTAAGTPLLPGVIWYSEIMSGEINHAVDIVIPGAAIAKFEYVKPAARAGGACGSSGYPLDGFPYGGRLRLKAGYDTSTYKGSQALVVLRALQKYGMLNTDASGEPRSTFRLGDGSRLDQADVAQLSKLTWDDFEVPTMTVVQSHACN